MDENQVASPNDPLIPKDNERSRRHKHQKRLLFALGSTTLTFLVISCIVLFFVSKNSATDPSGYHGHIVSGKTGAVAVEAEECSHTGIEILKQGGNAVDAAIASGLCIGVIDSFATGIGGGGFMLIRSPNGTYEHIDFRETAPAAAHKDMFVENPELAKYGGLAVAVPGEIRGYELAHQRHGKLPWSVLFEPAIRISREGFKCTSLLQERLKKAEPWLMEMPEWREIFAPNGHLAKAGDLIRRPNLANTLETIAKEGADAFYKGEIAHHLVNATRAAGGIMTLEDMASYKPQIRASISTYYHGRKVVSCSTPTSGPLIIAALNILERFNLRLHGYTGLDLHRIIETLKHGFSFRTEFGDPDYIHNQERMEEIITKEWASRIRQNISDHTTYPPLYYHPRYDHIESHGTMHLSVVDGDDGAVALTSTVNLLFGARFMDPVTGVILNDEMDDFSIPGKPNAFGLYPSEYNYVAPGKRPLSSITPVIIESDGKFELAVGGSGGSLIPTATLNVILNVIDFEKDLYSAVNAPRYHHQLLPNAVVMEPDFSGVLEQDLIRRGHEVFHLNTSQRISAVQAVMRLPDQTVHGVSDPRKLGIAAAY
ncbi:gamma-glutamyltransferase [Lichtheimia ornata]|uniref:Glutathione hydrolase n=1 Tax=Lichtheimia ornata TaxID=688661 RepID=A0AAD7V6Y2_9FUNG|nr:gamma-glutamyltransferase [Lichtheimia ornata]KAJ8659965.1 gamma-glutamyltransferase [Lichtheimia ornata]